MVYFIFVFVERFSGNANFNYLAEIEKAAETGTIAQDIAREQEKVRAADLVIFQFPMAWFSYPAILKGWLDRVLCSGFAFASEKGRLFDNGMMKVPYFTYYMYSIYKFLAFAITCILCRRLIKH